MGEHKRTESMLEKLKLHDAKVHLVHQKSVIYESRSNLWSLTYIRRHKIGKLANLVCCALPNYRCRIVAISNRIVPMNHETYTIVYSLIKTIDTMKSTNSVATRSAPPSANKTATNRTSPCALATA
jgi:hypothetical protein